MATFADFLTAPARDEVVLLELTPRVVVSGFTLTDTSGEAFGAQIDTALIDTAVIASGGLVYQTPLVRRELAGDINGGVYRRVVGVRENATNLTERTSIVTVHANPSSWWWDETNELLHVHSSTGADPDTFTAYQALVRFYLATKPALLNRVDGNADTGIYHLPWIVGGLPELIERDNDAMFATKIAQGGDIQLLNGHQFWHTVIAHDGDYRWKNANATFSLGGSYKAGVEVLLRSQYAALMTMQVDDVAADEELVTLALKPLTAKLTEGIPKTPFFESAYPNLGEGVRGTKKWVGYGRTTMRPDLTDISSHGIYTIADSAFQALFAVNSVTAINKTTSARTTLTLTTDYTVNLTACTVTIVNATYKWQDVFIELDVTGKPDGAGSYLKTMADVVKDILKTFAGVRDAEIDTASFSNANTDAAEEVTLWLKSPRTIASILATTEEGFPALEQSVRGLVMQTAAGLWQIRIWDPSYDAATLPTLRKSEFARFSPEPELQSIFSTVQVHYNFNHATGAWSVEEASDSVVKFQHDEVGVLPIYTFLRSSGDAQILAQRWLAVAGGLTLAIDFEEVGVRLAAHQARDRVLLDYDPAPVAAGKLDASPFELIELRRRFDPTLQVSGRFGNLRGIGQFIGRWTASAEPDYAAATEAERAKAGYWADSNGFVVPGDPTTKDISRWW